MSSDNEPAIVGADYTCPIIAFAAIVIWQIQIVFAAYRFAAVFGGLFASLGAHLPLLTTLYFESYRWWIVVPASFALLYASAIRGRWSKPAVVAAAVSGVIAAALMSTWATEACYGPMFSLIRQIG